MCYICWNVTVMQMIIYMKHGSFLVLFLVLSMALSCGVYAQDGSEKTPLPEFSLGIGSRFSSSPAFGSGFTQTVFPALRWQFDENWSLKAGALFTTSGSNNMPGMLYGGNEGLFGDNSTGRFMSTTLFAVGSYQLNPRLTITGGSWVERNTLEVRHDMAFPGKMTEDPMGLILGFDFKVSENFSFGAEFNYSRGYDPFSPFNMHHSPFGRYSSPFRYGPPGIW